MRLAPLLLLVLACGTTSTPAPTSAGAGSQPAATTTTADEKRDDGPVHTDKDKDGPPAGVKAPGNLPVMTRSQLEAEDRARNACLDRCEPQDDACTQACHEQFPVRQVEVVEDGPLGVPGE